MIRSGKSKEEMERVSNWELLMMLWRGNEAVVITCKFINGSPESSDALTFLPMGRNSQRCSSIGSELFCHSSPHSVFMAS